MNEVARGLLSIAATSLFGNPTKILSVQPARFAKAEGLEKCPLDVLVRCAFNFPMPLVPEQGPSGDPGMITLELDQ
jgi:hypothetical protein